MPAWLQTHLTASTIRAAFIGAMSLALAGPAAAQTMGFDPSDFGKVSMPRRQSTGDAATHIENNKGAFEPIAELDQRDPLARMAKPVGRIDILLKDNKTGKQSGAHCTGELLPGDYVLTTQHCLPQSGEMTPIRDEAGQPLGFVKVLRDRTQEQTQKEVVAGALAVENV